MASPVDPNSRMMTSALTMAPSVGTGGGGVDLMNQIPQAVATAVQPLIQNAGATISSTVASTLGADGGGGMQGPSITPRPGGIKSAATGMPTKGGIPSRREDQMQLGGVGPGGMPTTATTGGAQAGYSASGLLQDPQLAQLNAAFSAAEGGSVPAAQQVQAQGRGNDSMLVHMTPNEVRGLQALAVANGGSLTTNPQTGLPEAGFLESILPMAVGFALGPAGAGIAFGGLSSAASAGLLTGGLTALMTGDLGQGLMAGLGAFGGANLGSALSSAGAATEAELARSAMIESGTGELAADISAKQIAAMTPGASSAAGSQADILAKQMAGFGSEGAKSLAASTAYPSSTAFMQGAAQAAPSFSNAVTGLKSLGTSEGLSNVGTALADQFAGASGLEKAAMAGSALTTAAPLLEPEPMQFATPEQREWNYADPQAPTPRQYIQPSTADIIRGGQEYTYFTPSNPVPYAKGDSIDAEEAKEKKEKEELRENMGDFARYIYDKTGTNIDLQAIKKMMQLDGKAEGGMVHMEDGGFVMDARSVSEMGNGSSSAGLERLAQMGGMPIRGSGDGVSDSIPATIDGNPIAAVAREEAYFSPDAVKRIGGGSIQRGSDKLYAMMDKAIAARKKAGRGTDSGLGTLMA